MLHCAVSVHSIICSAMPTSRLAGLRTSWSMAIIIIMIIIIILKAFEPRLTPQYSAQRRLTHYAENIQWMSTRFWRKGVLHAGYITHILHLVCAHHFQLPFAFFRSTTQTFSQIQVNHNWICIYVLFSIKKLKNPTSTEPRVVIVNFYGGAILSIPGVHPDPALTVYLRYFR